MKDTTHVFNIQMEGKQYKTIAEIPNNRHLNNAILYQMGQRINRIKSSKEVHELNNYKFEIPVIKTPNRKDNRNYSRSYSTFLCFVTSIQKNTIKARIEDIKSNNKVYEEADFEIDDFDDEEKKMLKIGSVFYWSIGYEYTNGTKNNLSFIRFKRLPSFSQAEFDNALDLSTDLFNNLNWID